MKTRNILIIVAVALFVIGGIMCGVVYASNGFDLRNLNTEELVTRTYDVGEEFNSISIKVATDDIVFEKSTDSACHVICYEHEDDPANVRVESGTLTIDRKSNKKFQLQVGINVASPKITVRLNKESYEKLFIKTDTGDVQFGDIAFGDVDLSSDTGSFNMLNVEAANTNIKTDTGDIDLKEFSSENVTIATDTGDLRLDALTVEGTIKIDTDTGDVKFNGCDAAEIYVKTDTGDVEGSFLSDKVFTTKTDTGDVRVPNTTSGGKCEIITTTGDINIK